MLQKNLVFLRKLKENNNREWFENHRDEYEQSQQELIAFADGLIRHIQGFDPAIGPQKPKDTIFRIYRDVRFSNDKSPYKTARGVVIKPGGRKSSFGAYYVHIEPGAGFVGGGIYHPAKSVLDAMRRKIYFEYESFFRIMKEESFKNTFGTVRSREKLKRMPKGYEVGHPAEEYLKFKNYLIDTSLSDEQLTNPRLAELLAQKQQAAQPFIHFINEAVEEAGEG